ncbi:MAG: 4-hydroxy-tetrahydrodipicolinate reductase [Chlamydiae bacterium]|nr:4-hydroxy-tetrahydrodipicolinate reductase [Chlamydiota bacterium]
MKIALFGYGKMGKLVETIAKQRGHAIIAKGRQPTEIAEADVIIDFSHASSVVDHVRLAIDAGTSIVIGTTGWDQEIDTVKSMVGGSGIGALYCPNFSVGMALFLKLLSKMAPLMKEFPEYDPVGVEFHHNQKKDSPSGSAKKISEIVGGDLAFTSIRCGSIPGKHQVIFDSPVDTITISHEVRNREGFAVGSIKAAEWIIDKQGWHTFNDMVGTLYGAHHSF